MLAYVGSFWSFYLTDLIKIPLGPLDYGVIYLTELAKIPLESIDFGVAYLLELTKIPLESIDFRVVLSDRADRNTTRIYRYWRHFI